jgi:hypothetical protein
MAKNTAGPWYCAAGIFDPGLLYTKPSNNTQQEATSNKSHDREGPTSNKSHAIQATRATQFKQQEPRNSSNKSHTIQATRATQFKQQEPRP